LRRSVPPAAGGWGAGALSWYGVQPQGGGPQAPPPGAVGGDVGQPAAMGTPGWTGQGAPAMGTPPGQPGPCGAPGTAGQMGGVGAVGGVAGVGAVGSVGPVAGSAAGATPGAPVSPSTAPASGCSGTPAPGPSSTLDMNHSFEVLLVRGNHRQIRAPEGDDKKAGNRPEATSGSFLVPPVGNGGVPPESSARQVRCFVR